jgi:hypothetical protein
MRTTRTGFKVLSVFTGGSCRGTQKSGAAYDSTCLSSTPGIPGAGKRFSRLCRSKKLRIGMYLNM